MKTNHVFKRKRISIMSYSKIKKIILGQNERMGWLAKFGLISLLTIIGFIYVYPVLYMLSASFKDLSDLVNASVQWIPTQLYTGNFKRAYEVLDYLPSLIQTILVAFLPALIQMMVCAFVGYGFAIYRFKAKKILLGLVVLTFVIPPQITMIPRYMLFNQLGILDSLLAYVIPATFGQGINSGIFIFIFYQTFRSLPKVLLEAARLDGAGELKIFYLIGIPSGLPGFLTTFLFSLVWYWNETYLASVYFGERLTTLPLQLQRFVASYNQLFPSQGDNPLTSMNEGIELAATLLTIAPLLFIYFITQKWFVESIDKSGITGE
ncbi:carbohydrate ABC transporter permease [Enterococcus sp. N249-2]